MKYVIRTVITPWLEPIQKSVAFDVPDGSQILGFEPRGSEATMRVFIAEPVDG